MSRRSWGFSEVEEPQQGETTNVSRMSFLTVPYMNRSTLLAASKRKLARFPSKAHCIEATTAAMTKLNAENKYEFQPGRSTRIAGTSGPDIMDNGQATLVAPNRPPPWSSAPFMIRERWASCEKPAVRQEIPKHTRASRRLIAVVGAEIVQLFLLYDKSVVRS